MAAGSINAMNAKTICTHMRRLSAGAVVLYSMQYRVCVVLVHALMVVFLFMFEIARS